MMKGLILKDIYTLRQQGKIYLFMAVFFAVISLIGQDSSSLIGVICVLVAMLPVTALSYDERSNWDRYALTMPLTRRDIVLGKYLLAFISSVIGFLFAFCFTLITNGNLPQSAFLAAAFWLLSLFLFSVLMPVFFKFGVEKGRMIMLAVFFVPTALILIGNSLNLPLPKASKLESLQYVVPVIVIFGGFLSYQISKKIYDQKEY